MNVDEGPEDPSGHLNSLLEGEIRNGFIRKVYGILSVQLFLTGAIAFPIQQNPEWVSQNEDLCRIAMFASLFAVFGVSCCCYEMAKKFPFNYMFLFFVTACQGLIVGFICSMYTGESVLMAALMTAGIFFGLTIYAMTTKSDFTGLGGYLYAALLGLMLTSFLCIFFPRVELVEKVMAGAGAILFSFFIVYDTQLICGGKHKKHVFGVDDYVFAALNIYLDIINLFLYLLRLFGDRR